MSRVESTQKRQDDTVAQQYEGWARVYDLFWRRYVNQTISVLQRAACVQPGECVLDVACGTGAFERRVAAERPDADLVGIDLAPSVVERAWAKLDGVANARFEQADAHDLPFDDSSFDAGGCANMFHYFTHSETGARRVPECHSEDARKNPAAEPEQQSDWASTESVSARRAH